MRRAVSSGVVFLSIALLTGLLSGCACYQSGFCTLPYTVGPVDYVDGGPGATEADCGQVVGSCNGVNPYGTTMYGASGCGVPMGCAGTPCLDCLHKIGYGIRAVGECALSIVAAPFVIAGHVICSGCNGYESYPNCGCSNEVYYGDNCSQAHDYVSCCNSCSAGGTSTSGCATCNNGYTEGVRSMPAESHSASGRETTYSGPVNGSARLAQQSLPQSQQKLLPNRQVRPVTYNAPYGKNYPQTGPYGNR